MTATARIGVQAAMDDDRATPTRMPADNEYPGEDTYGAAGLGPDAMARILAAAGLPAPPPARPPPPGDRRWQEGCPPSRPGDATKRWRTDWPAATMSTARPISSTARCADGARRRLRHRARGGRAGPPGPGRRRCRAPDRTYLIELERRGGGFAWVNGDLATLDLGQRFEAVLLAGNVMTFSMSNEGQVMERLAAHLEPGGYLVAGFHTQPRFPLPRLPVAATTPWPSAPACGRWPAGRPGRRRRGHPRRPTPSVSISRPA